MGRIEQKQDRGAITGVSVIVPCFKRVKQTLRTIDLIFGSRGWGKEFLAEVIVADSSPDFALKTALLKKFAVDTECQQQLFYLKPKKVGIAINKNAGAKQAKYPVLIFCDSDIEIEPDTLLKTIQSLQKYPEATGITGMVIWKGGKNEGKLDRSREEDRFIKRGIHIFAEMIYSRYFATYKDIFWQVGGYDEQVFNMRGEGSDLSMRYWRAGFPLCFDPTIKVFHREDASDSIALRVKNAHFRIAKDMWLLGIKYGNFEKFSPNFLKTLEANFAKYEDPVFVFCEGLFQHADFIKLEGVSLLQAGRSETPSKPRYPFEFLETFSKRNRGLLKKIISQI